MDTTNLKNNSVMVLNQLPVFELNGSEGGIVERFAELLTPSLVRRNILSIVVRADNVPDLLALHRLVKEYDLVFIDGETDFPLQKITLLPAGIENIADSLSCVVESKSSRLGFLAQLFTELRAISRRLPVWGCILIGGKSSRMGKPKHLIEDEYGEIWLEQTVAVLNPLVDGIVISGAGDIPKSLSAIPQLADIPGVVGPLSGILAATRWQPRVSWLLVACDMPHISGKAVEWLLEGRYPGSWGLVPRITEDGYHEPLLAWYDMRAGELFEAQLLGGNMRVGQVADHPKIANPIIPVSLRYSWGNVNTPEQLKQLRSE